MRSDHSKRTKFQNLVVRGTFVYPGIPGSRSRVQVGSARKMALSTTLSALGRTQLPKNGKSFPLVQQKIIRDVPPLVACRGSFLRALLALHTVFAPVQPLLD